jgi:hypothetical protein
MEQESHTRIPFSGHRLLGNKQLYAHPCTAARMFQHACQFITSYKYDLFHGLIEEFYCTSEGAFHLTIYWSSPTLKLAFRHRDNTVNT